MGWLDKLLGRGKAAAGEATDSPELRQEGRTQEAAAEAKETAEEHVDRAKEEMDRAGDEAQETWEEKKPDNPV